MSTPLPRPEHTPLIALVDRLDRELQADMVRSAHAAGYPEVKPSHNAVFGTLPSAGARTADMAARAGITRQSMGEVVRDMVDLGIVEMAPDPDDRRAKIVTFTAYGLGLARAGRQHIVDLEARFADELGADRYGAARDVIERVVGLLAPAP